MLHVVQYILECDRSYGTRVGGACKQVFVVPTMEIDHGAVIQDGPDMQWCPACHALKHGVEANMGLPTDMGVVVDGNGLGPAEESELGALESDDTLGTAEETFPDDPAPTFGR